MSDFNLTFDDNAPIDVNKLRQLVIYLNEVRAKALQTPDQAASRSVPIK